MLPYVCILDSDNQNLQRVPWLVQNQSLAELFSVENYDLDEMEAT